MAEDNSEDHSAEQFPRREVKTGPPGSKLKFYLESADGGVWSYLQRSAGEMPKEPLYKILNWMLEQLSLGNGAIERDERGDVVSLTLGREAAAEKQNSVETASEVAGRRLLAVYLAGLVAQMRESGASPAHAPMSKMFTQQSTDWGHRNTEFHYAFELVKVLARVNKKTFDLEAPPIVGTAPSSVVSYLRESTKCWLYGFHGASVGLSRACVEEGLRTRLGMSGDLEPLINAAARRGVLDDCMANMAHMVRKAGNKFLHGKRITEKESRETLDATRSIVEQMFSS